MAVMAGERHRSSCCVSMGMTLRRRCGVHVGPGGAASTEKWWHWNIDGRPGWGVSWCRMRYRRKESLSRRSGAKLRSLKRWTRGPAQKVRYVTRRVGVHTYSDWS